MAAEPEQQAAVPHGFFEEDDIHPRAITHDCQEIYDSGKLLQRYNFLMYEFLVDGLVYRGRTYLDEIRKVSIFGPYEGPQSTRELPDHLIDERILAYFKRRYPRIDRYETGTHYRQIWPIEPAG